MDTTFEESPITPKRGEVKPIHTFSPARRGIDEDTVADLVKALTRDCRFLHPIVVRAEGAAKYRLIAGRQRLEASTRRFGKQRPIPATIYPPDTPDALITILEIEENLLRKELTAAERQAQTIRLAAALKKLNGGKPVTPVSESGEAAETGNLVPCLAPASGGRGNKVVAQKVAEKAGISKRAVRKRLKAASAAIGEKIDLDLDTPEELERKADKRQHAEPKVERPKRRKPAPHGVSEDPTQPAKPRAAKIGSQIEDLWNAFDAIGRTCQLRSIHDACLRLGLDPLMMAPPAAFGLADEEPELAVDLPTEVAPATDDAAEAADLGADDLEHAGDAAAEAADLGGEDLEHAGDHTADAANLGAEDPEDAGGDVSEAADQEPGGATKCAYCTHPFASGDQRYVVNGLLYHDSFCLDHDKKIAIAAE